jgi:predicted TIM-barrel fold metal-dependent hydrolase
MIDCHTHAYPAVGERLDRALDRLSPDAGFIARDALEDLRGLMGGLATRARSWAQRLPTLGALERIPAPLWRGVLLPQIVVNGHVDRLLSSMDENGIDRAIVIAAPPWASNEWLLREAFPRARSRLIPVAALPSLPAEGPDASWTEALESLAAAGARGFKIHPNLDGLPADHAAYRAVFEVAQRLGKFVILHTGHFSMLGYRRSSGEDPAAFEPLFREYPQVRVCLAHMNRDKPEAAWELMRRHDQLFTDTSWQPQQNVRTALKEVGARRVLLGSDWPLLSLSLQQSAVRILKDAAADKELERVAQYTPRVFLGEA